ncbi:MAG: sn-glycerol-3-phosphate ABC transporter ATP-binding protein UgpC [Clostridiales Family XIII bacterium]|jgi:multiple sugar transport system ATP-binding protein|nr:sn-glycerol-3-phosphate ABC transporter ATP-binding protein UgpC [Clostridiales Family XIII bacterium]
MSSISLRNVYKIYPGDVVAVSDFCMEIEDKEFIVLVGPSGCGKSTTLRMIAGLEDISKGELYIGDRLVNDVPPKERNIAMVFQNYALYPHMSVFRNMAFALELRKTPKDEIQRRVTEAARVLEIEHLLQRKPKELSGGQRQRVALGRAMVRSPSVFLLDEPLSNLDAKLRASMRTEISKLHKRLGTTFVYVTHDQTEAMTMGSRIVVMKDGLVQQTDTPQNLYDRPCNVFVAGFIGSPQMNFLDGELGRDEGGCFIDLGGDRLHIDESAAEGRLEPYFGRQVRAGIRPEDIYDEDAFWADPRDGGVPCAKSVIRADVEVSEPMGSEVYLYLDYGGRRLTARVAPTTKSKAGDSVRVAIDTRRIHLFDPETEMAIMGVG